MTCVSRDEYALLQDRDIEYISICCMVQNWIIDGSTDIESFCREGSANSLKRVVRIQKQANHLSMTSTLSFGYFACQYSGSCRYSSMNGSISSA